MTFEEFLGAIQPNLTVLAALFAFLLLFIRLFWFFLTYEENLRTENISRLRDLLASFQEQQLFKPLQEELDKNIEVGYSYALSRLYPKVFDPNTGTTSRMLIAAEKAIELTQFSKEDDFFTNLAADRVTTKTGQEIVEALEKNFQKTTAITSQYENIKKYCRIVWIACIILSFLCILGMILFINPSDTLTHFWIFSSSVVFLIGLTSFILLFWNRHNLIDKWERVQIYGD